MPTKPPSTRDSPKTPPEKVVILPEEIAEASAYAQKVYASDTFRSSEFLAMSNMYLMAKYIQFLEYQCDYLKRRNCEILFIGTTVIWTVALLLGIVYYIFITWSDK